jgi:hypothetical protein
LITTPGSARSATNGWNHPAATQHVTTAEIDPFDRWTEWTSLSHGSENERQNRRLIGQGQGIHWPDLDEDISVDSLLAGRASGESQASLEKWLRSRKQAG